MNVIDRKVVINKKDDYLKISIKEELPGGYFFLGGNIGDEWIEMIYFVYDKDNRLVLENESRSSNYANAQKGEFALDSDEIKKAVEALREGKTFEEWLAAKKNAADVTKAENLKSRREELPNIIEGQKKLLSALERELESLK